MAKKYLTYLIFNILANELKLFWFRPAVELKLFQFQNEKKLGKKNAFNSLSADASKWSNTLKLFVGCTITKEASHPLAAHIRV